MKKTTVLLLLFLANILAYAQSANYAQYVDPFIGTGGHGHTFPGATLPFGMVQLSPDTRIDGSWDGCGGYHYSDSVIYGFTHTHLSGTGVSDYGDILFMPTIGKPSTDNKEYASRFSHKNEKASAGYYAVKLDNGVQVELTATTRVGFHKYTFPQTEQANIILDLTHRDKTLKSSLRVVSPTRIEGMRRSEAWARDQHIYFVAEFSKPLFDTTNTPPRSRTISMNGEIKVEFQFKTKAGESIYVKVGISTVSIEGASKNLETELPGWDFEKVKKQAEQAWNKELGKIEIQATDKEKLKIFYTALYHTMIQPNVNMDVDGSYRGRDNRIHRADGFTYYSVFSLWDTFRGAHPLYTIIDRKRTLDFIQTFLAQYRQGGRLPVWEFAGNETDCMIGYHSVSVIADAAVKGITGFDMLLALEAMKKSANWNHYGLPAYIKNGYLSIDDEPESVSKTLEYAYDDWCIAQMAQLLRQQDDYAAYSLRSQSWKNVLDTQTGFMRPRKNGGWLTPFEPREINNHFTEGNSWHYTFFVPQDVNGLIEKMGGVTAFEKKLDELFSAASQTTGREQADVTGLIGQYAHGNEPSHHMAYLYNYVNKPSKTAYRVHQILTEFYHASPDGLIGNEDCGQMSAWYVLSSIGIYPVTPGSKDYLIGTPLFSQVKIHLENGNTFSLVAKNGSDKNRYIQSTQLNNRNHDKNFISYDDIVNGSVLLCKMSGQPAEWGTFTPSIPGTTEEKIVTAPVIISSAKAFKDTLRISIHSMEDSSKIYYSLDGTSPTPHSPLYTTPLMIDTTTTIQAIAVDTLGKPSGTTVARFYKTPHHRKIKINSHYHSQYSAGGDEALVDGIRGDANWRKGDWQGYQGEDVEVIIDLGKTENISEVAAGFLQDTRSWIIMPVKVEFHTSIDHTDFTLAGSIENNIQPDDYNVQIKVFNLPLNKTFPARYIKMKAYTFGTLPPWHLGAGGMAYIFVDEIVIK